MEEKDYIINVGPGGTFKKSGDYQTLPSDVNAIFQRLEKERPKKIALYFHGGLNGEKEGRKIALKMKDHIVETGCTPICFVWETGLIETVATNIRTINETDLFKKLVRLLIKKLAPHLGFEEILGRGTGRAITYDEIESELAKENPFASFTQDIPLTKTKSRGGISPIDALPSDPELLKELEEEIKREVNKDEDAFNAALITQASQDKSGRGLVSLAGFIKAVAIVAFRIIKRFVEKIDHSFYPTLMEEIFREFYIADLGAWVWSGMKKKSELMWSVEPEDNTEEGQRAGQYFLQKLLEYKNRYPETRIDLVGHSAGSIAICNLLKQTDKSLVFGNILFMAPACRVDLFYREMVSAKNRFTNFRMFTMYNEFEKQDNLVPFLYTHSLLYLISGILEDNGKSPDAWILGLERHISDKPPYDSDNTLKEVHDYLFDSSENRIVFSKSKDGSAEGLLSRSTSHGGFDDDVDFTIKSLKYLISQ
ncbi:MAG: hypothetical protein NT084_10655 [Bacteroidetes bacterium]|nr:hypothetical protein [Bacteroidota bacterium]